MSGRRSHTRFSVMPSSEGHLRIPRDVLLQVAPIPRSGSNGARGGELVAISREAGVVGEQLTLGIVGREEGPCSMRVIESRPIVVDGTMRHRVLMGSVKSGDALKLVAPLDPLDNDGRSNSVSNGVTGVITRSVSVRVPNCSASGCLLETHSSLEVGTIGTIELWMGEENLCDQVRIVRCQSIQGAGALFHLGAEFLWTSAPTRSSLRRAMDEGLAVMTALRA
jgi:hypothetical protein